MNINFNTFPNYALSHFKKGIPFSLTSLQKKILVVASIACGVLAACYLMKRLCFTAKSLTDMALENEQSCPGIDVLKDYLQSHFAIKHIKYPAVIDAVAHRFCYKTITLDYATLKTEIRLLLTDIRKKHSMTEVEFSSLSHYVVLALFDCVYGKPLQDLKVCPIYSDLKDYLEDDTRTIFIKKEVIEDLAGFFSATYLPLSDQSLAAEIRLALEESAFKRRDSIPSKIFSDMSRNDIAATLRDCADSKPPK